MTVSSVFARAAELEAAGRPFAVATVVAVKRPTSARPGASGIVHPDGTIEGWVGGSCAQPVVVREALRSLVDGQPRLLRLSKDGPGEGRRADGVIELVMTCHSGGTLEIYVEPHLAAPQLWVIGTTPIAGALARLGSVAGWRVTVIDPIAEADAFPAAERVHVSADIRGLDPDASPYVVVASQGIWDEEAVAARADPRGVLRRAWSPRRHVPAWFATGCARRRRSATSGSPPCGPRPDSTWAPRPPRRSPCRSSPSWSRCDAAGRTSWPRPGRRPSPAAIPASITLEPVVDDIVLLDPVCGMTVDRATARHLAEHDGVIYAFCSMGCRTRFIKEPATYLSATAPSPMHD